MKWPVLCLAVALVVASQSAAIAQNAAPGALHGRVTDQTGAVVIGAVVRLENAAREQRHTVTDRQGEYTFDNVPPGPHHLIVFAPAFVEFSASVELASGQSTSLDVSLALGLFVSLEVKEAAGRSTDPRRNGSAVILTGRDIVALPDDPRLFLSRLLQMAGASGRPGDVAVYVDGFREYKRLPPKAAIDIIRINSNTFSAEFSQPSVKRIEIATKPGSDGFHGDLALRARSNRLDARHPLADAEPLGAYRHFNGYVQGPIRKERLGFLVYGGRWQQDDNAVVHATIVEAATAAARPFTATLATPTTVTSGLFKADFTLFNQTFNASYSRTDERHRNQGLDGGFDLPERAYDRATRDDTARLWWTRIGTRSLNDARFELTRGETTLNALTAAPAVLVLDAFNAGGNQDAASRATTRGVQAGETFTVASGKHTIKTGVEFERGRQRSVDRTGFGGTFTFGADVERDAAGVPIRDLDGEAVTISPLENYRRTLLGLPGYGPTQFAVVRGSPEVEVSQWHVGWFVLDDWSISRRLSLSYGIRQELQNNLALRPNLAPRASLSWLIDDRGRNALKLGAGVFHARVAQEITLETRKSSGTARQQFVVRRPTFAREIPASFDLAAGGEPLVYVKSADLRTPSSFVTTATYERQLPYDLFAVAEYLFAKGVHLLRLREIALGSSDTASPVLQFESTGRSLQHELMVGLRGDINSSFSLYGNYRLGRKDSDTDHAYTIPARSGELGAEFGPSADDRRHQLVVGGTVHSVGGVWIEPAVSLSSGRPFNITTGRDDNGDTFFADRPVFAGPADEGAIVTPFGTFNPSPQTGDRLIARNFGREQWEFNVQLSVSKSLAKGVTITAHADNLLNTTRVVRSSGVLTSPEFGLPNRALNARRLELTIRFGF